MSEKRIPLASFKFGAGSSSPPKKEKASSLTYVHYLASKKGGPIRSQRREVVQGDQTAEISRGGEYAVACNENRRYLSRVAPDGTVIEAFMATADVNAVSCLKCIDSPLFKRDIAAAKKAAEAARKVREERSAARKAARAVGGGESK